jgi:hypothetical protein
MLIENWINLSGLKGASAKLAHRYQRCEGRAQTAVFSARNSSARVEECDLPTVAALPSKEDFGTSGYARTKSSRLALNANEVSSYLNNGHHQKRTSNVMELNQWSWISRAQAGLYWPRPNVSKLLVNFDQPYELVRQAQRLDEEPQLLATFPTDRGGSRLLANKPP